MTNEPKKPIHKIKVGNGIVASIWANKTDEGVLHTVEVERRYQEKGSEEWKTANSYTAFQALLVAKAYELSFVYITGLKSS